VVALGDEPVPHVNIFRLAEPVDIITRQEFPVKGIEIIVPDGGGGKRPYRAPRSSLGLTPGEDAVS
jgi:hypothetical protein